MIITIVETPDGDWKAIYFNDDLFDQGHSFRLMDVLEELVGKEIEAVDHFYVKSEDHFPESLSDVKR